MNSSLIRPLILGVFAFPLLVAAQQGGEGRLAPAAAGSQGAPGQVIGQAGAGPGVVVGTGSGPGQVGGQGPVPGQAVGVGRGQVVGSEPGQVVGVGSRGAAGSGLDQVVGVGRGQVVGTGSGGTGEVVVYSDPGNNFFSNVPINELSAKAYRRFHRRFKDVPTGEYWYKYEQGYQVSFMLDQHHEFAYFGTNGIFLYSVRYYDGKEISRDMAEIVKRRFPDYKVDVVTEVNDGMRTFYMLQIMNPENIKTLTIADGRIDIVKEMVNGSANIGPAEAAR